MKRHPSTKVGVCRRDRGGGIFRNEFEFLAKAATNDDVVAIQANGHGFASGNLFFDVFID